MRSIFVLFVCALVYSASAINLPMSSITYGRATDKRNVAAAVLPGDPIITGGLAQGAVTAVSLYSKVILAR